MKNTPKKIKIALLFCVILIGACETVVTVDLDIEPQPVVNMLLTENNNFRAILTQSIPQDEYQNSYGDNKQFLEIENASFTITAKGTTTTSIPLSYQTLSENDAYFAPVNGVYTTQSTPLLGTSYDLTIEVPNFETVTASTIMPNPILIEQVDTSTFYGRIEALDTDSELANYLQFDVQFQNPIEERNYYGLKIRNPEGNNPYFVLPAYENSNRSLIYYEGFQLFTDELLQEGTLDLEVLIDYNNLIFNYTDDLPTQGENVDLEVVLATFNKDMYNYISSARRQTQSDGFFEELFFEPINVYSNINNGLGIFGAMSTDTMLIDL